MNYCPFATHSTLHSAVSLHVFDLAGNVVQVALGCACRRRGAMSNVEYQPGRRHTVENVIRTGVRQ